MLACILALPLALLPSVDASMQSEIDAAIDRGVAHLLSHYDGSAAGATIGFDPRRADWGEPNGDGVHALILYTLLKCGVDRDHEVVRQILTRLSAAEIKRTYNAACLLLALEEHDAVAHREWIQDLADQLVEWQSEDGAWAYPNGKKD